MAAEHWMGRPGCLSGSDEGLAFRALVPLMEDTGCMRFGRFTFGSIEIDGTIYDHDVVIDRGHIRKRKKGPSKPFRGRFGHTPLSLAEDIPWTCGHLIVGTGAYGALPVMEEVVAEAERRQIQLVIAPTAEALEQLGSDVRGTNAILHVTC
jgi:hypothetical protein